MFNGAGSYRRFLNGDESGLVEIVEEYKDGLILFLNRYVSDFYVAEDLAEDTFFKLVIKKPRYVGDSSFKAWLYTIARNFPYNTTYSYNSVISFAMDNICSATWSGEMIFACLPKLIIQDKKWGLTATFTLQVKQSSSFFKMGISVPNLSNTTPTRVFENRMVTSVSSPPNI